MPNASYHLTVDGGLILTVIYSRVQVIALLEHIAAHHGYGLVRPATRTSVPAQSGGPALPEIVFRPTFTREHWAHPLPQEEATPRVQEQAQADACADPVCVRCKYPKAAHTPYSSRCPEYRAPTLELPQDRTVLTAAEVEVLLGQGAEDTQEPAQNTPDLPPSSPVLASTGEMPLVGHENLGTLKTAPDASNDLYPLGDCLGTSEHVPLEPSSVPQGASSPIEAWWWEGTVLDAYQRLCQDAGEPWDEAQARILLERAHLPAGADAFRWQHSLKLLRLRQRAQEGSP